ncbi:MAG: DNA-directed RNA polymerase subunit alpha [Candidatus Pacebacteria bacterium]|nr:DNA-directed RNA polymerase subunit alpha [Candidatus Paceibacterota bacterium]
MIPLPNAPKIVKKEGNQAVFEIEALYPGYGATIGNSLRRVLLSSLPGVAATQMKIKGVAHEFSTIPGVIEDVISIMLNLKQLRFKVFSDEPQTGRIKIKGEKEVKGSDLELPSQVELINKNCHIATLTSRTAELDMEITIEKGIGYSPREARKKEKLEIGVIPLDAIFTPVQKVSFKLENMRVGERTDFDKITLEVETDGTLTPEKAFYEASEILVNHFTLLFETFKEAAQKEEIKTAPAEKPKKKKTSEKKHEKKKKR